MSRGNSGRTSGLLSRHPSEAGLGPDESHELCSIPGGQVHRVTDVRKLAARAVTALSSGEELHANTLLSFGPTLLRIDVDGGESVRPSSCRVEDKHTIAFPLFNVVDIICLLPLR